ncbi:hypothetical protein XM38_022340 [Halomicronema hongdechloris C2206]|uniref:Uncharacterized protein n=1 Tax=Halomicronema hongdechloris C2206 TaxID=1641165 RepID=A0A1Z3HLU2_9CYAN|nr:hypothetical protein [Halomicronema hongdechloris]ASC71282.1 hypothetical protein XM38_022340 [Halomicronema hongdechloris C2206]
MSYYSNHYRQPRQTPTRRPQRHPDGQLRRASTPRSQPQPAPRRRSRRQAGVLLAGSSMLALAALVVTPFDRSEQSRTADLCQQRVQSQSVLSRDELSQLLTVAERSSKETVRQIIQEPYCVLSPVTVREGAQAEREAYPLEFDPQTWFVVLYEEGEYAGYDFSFRR